MASAPEGPVAERGHSIATSVDEFLGTGPGAAWRRWMKWIAIGLAAVALTILVGRFVNGGQATEYASETVERADLTVKLTGSGRLQPIGVRSVGTRQIGTIGAVLVRENERVTRGQVLARLDTAPFRDAIDRARQLLDARQAVLDKAEAQERELMGQLSLYDRVRRQSGGRVPSDREIGMARADFNRAAAAVQDAQTEVAAARADLADRQAQLDATEIRSPGDGTVLHRYATVGQSTGHAPGQALFAIAAPYSTLRLTISLNRAQAQRLNEASAARALVSDTSGHAAPASIVRVAPIPAPPPGPAESGSSADNVSVGVVLEVNNTGLKLRPGAEATVQIDLGTHRDVLVVPDSALGFARASDAAQAPRPVSGEPSGEAVYVVESDGTPHRMPVTVGGGDGSRSEVTSDMLQPGMRVITGLR